MSEIPTRREARTLLEAKVRPINRGLHGPQSTATFRAFVAERFVPCILPTLKFATQQIYSLLLDKHLVPRFGTERLCDITKAEIQGFLLEKLKQGLSWETTNHLRHLLSKVLRTAVEWNYLPESPVRGAKMPERVLKNPRTFLNADEARRLLAALQEPERTIVLVAMLTGLRIGEILALRWGRVNLDGATLRVEESCYKGVFGTPKTRASRREVPLAPGVVRALAAHRSGCSDVSLDALVFSTRKGTPLAADNLRKRALALACHRLGLKQIGWHSFRRTHATLLHAQGTPLKVAQVLLGHSDIAVTLEAYTQTMTEAQREAVAKLEQVLFPSVPRLGHGQEGSQSETQRIQ